MKAPIAYQAEPAPPVAGERRMSSGDAGYVSARSADALLSDLRPTTLQPQCLVYLNELLDELLSSIIQASLGLGTDKLKTQAISTIIPPPLGRDAVGEAELELLSWLDSDEGRMSRGIKEVRYVATQQEADQGQVWPWREAWELMRVMTQSYSTLGDRPPSDALEKSFIAALSAQGGDVRPGIIDPAALYLTAILEHIAEYVLGSLSRVMSHEQGLSIAGPKELHSALCEDEALYGMVKKMQIKVVLERAIQVSRKSTSSNAGSHTKKASTSSQSFPAHYSVANACSDTNRPAALNGSRTIPHDYAPGLQPGSAGLRSSLDSSEGPISPLPYHLTKQSISLGRKSTSSSRQGSGSGDGSHREGKSSTQSYEEEIMDERAEEERDFDDFLRGGKTMKLSLTPQSLKSNETYVQDSAPRRNQSVARRPVPALDEPTSATNGGGPPSSSLRRNVSKVSQGPTPRFAAREPTLRVDEDEEYEEDEEDMMMRGGRKPAKKESLAELLGSAPPWADSKPNPSRLTKPNTARSAPSSPAPPAAYRPSANQPPSTSPALNKRLGLEDPVSQPSSPPSPANGSPKTPPSMRTSSSMGGGSSKFAALSGQSAPMASRPQARSPKSYEEDSDSDDELLGRKPKAKPIRSADLIAFLDGPPPSSMRQQPSQPNLADDFDNGAKPTKKKGFKGFVSKLTGGTPSSSSSSKATDGLPPVASAPYSAANIRSTKSSAQPVSSGHQPSGSITSRIPGIGMRRSRSDASLRAKDEQPKGPDSTFVANPEEPLPSTSSRLRSKSQTAGSQSSNLNLEPAPPLPQQPQQQQQQQRQESPTDLAYMASPARTSSRSTRPQPPPPAVSTHPASRSSSHSSSPRGSPRVRQPTGSSPPPPASAPSAAADPHQGDASENDVVAPLPTISHLHQQPSSPRASSVFSDDSSAAAVVQSRAPVARASPMEIVSLAAPAAAAAGLGAVALGRVVQVQGHSPVPSQKGEVGYAEGAAPVEEKEEQQDGPRTEVAPPLDKSGEIVPQLGPGPPAQATTTTANTAAPPADSSSVSHASLLQLRSLLSHATTADECRLLVGALLSRWGVPLAAPPASEPGNNVARDQEQQLGRVHGWLLEEYAAVRLPESGSEAEEEAESVSEYESTGETLEARDEVEVAGKQEEILQSGGVLVKDEGVKAEQEKGEKVYGGLGVVV